MATITDHLITKYSLQDDYTAKASKVAASTRSVGLAQNQAADGFTSMGNSAKVASIAATMAAAAIVGLMAGAMAYVRLHQDLIAQGSALMRHAGEWEALSMALDRVEDSAEAAKDQMEDLRQMSKAPGLGFREAVSGYIGFRRGGLSEGFSERLLRELGNQVALSGGGRDMFGRMSYAATELARQPFLQGDEMRQFTEAGLPAHQIVSSAFGTSDPEELKRRGVTAKQVLEALVVAMEAMPRAGDSAQNTFDSLGDSIDYAKKEAGDALNEAFLPMVKTFAETVDLTTDAGITATVFESLANSFDYLNVSGEQMQGVMLSVGAGMMTLGDTMSVAAGGVAALIDSLAPIVKLALGNNDGSVLDWLEQQFATNQRTLEMQLELFRKRQARAQKDAEKPPEALPEDPALPYLREIAINTHEALQIDMKRYAFGGGDLGRLGVSPVELGAIKGYGGSIKVEVKGARNFESALAGMLTDTIAGLVRAGKLKVVG